MSWEVDWSHAGNTGTVVMARNTSSHLQSARQWHAVPTGYLRLCGVTTPTYRRDSWEVDWQRRNGKLVWARNPNSKMPSSRGWHWVDFHTLSDAGIRWRPKDEHRGRYTTSDGYVVLTRPGMTDDEAALAEQHGLFRGARKQFVREHHLVAVKRFGGIPSGHVVRHLNGIKDDNRPENLALGTSRENTLDHVTARREVAYWRARALKAESELATLQGWSVLRCTPDQIRSGAVLALLKEALS